jgi:hypothetical protein
MKLIRKLLLGFKILIWEPRNELQIRKEKKHNISNKDKIKKSSGIKSYIENAHFIVEKPEKVNGINGMIFLSIVVGIGQTFRRILTVT